MAPLLGDGDHRVYPKDCEQYNYSGWATRVEGHVRWHAFILAVNSTTESMRLDTFKCFVLIWSGQCLRRSVTNLYPQTPLQFSTPYWLDLKVVRDLRLWCDLYDSNIIWSTEDQKLFNPTWSWLMQDSI